jgi:hypothetical protein
MDVSKLKKWSSEKPGELPAGQTPVDAPIAHPLPAEPEPVAPRVEREVPRSERRANEYVPAAPITAGFGVFLSLILGLVFMLLGQQFARWGIATLSGNDYVTGKIFPPGGPDGNKPVPYWQLDDMSQWTDLGLFSLGAALLVDAVLMLVASRRGRVNPILFFSAFGVVSCAVATNLVVGWKFMSLTPPVTPIVSIVAVIAGAFVLFDHWAVWREGR